MMAEGAIDELQEEGYVNLQGGKDSLLKPALDIVSNKELESEVDLSMTCVELDDQGITLEHLDMLRKKQVVVVGSGLTLTHTSPVL